jgi:membrane protease YdiL (CAAX protease family)
VEPIDHILAGAILFVCAAQAFAGPEILRRAPRLAFFKAGAITGLGICALVLLAWHGAGRPLGEFGLAGWAGERPGLAAAVAAAWPLLLLGAAWLSAGPFRGTALGYYRRYEHLMPHDRRELAPAYSAGSLAALGEEIAFRGFLIWYLQSLAGLGAALLVSSILFGIAHGYLGRVGIVFATIAGLVLGSAYVASGSLLLVIWMHASYNVASFTLGYRLLREA